MKRRASAKGGEEGLEAVLAGLRAPALPEGEEARKELCKEIEKYLLDINTTDMFVLFCFLLQFKLFYVAVFRKQLLD